MREFQSLEMHSYQLAHFARSRISIYSKIVSTRAFMLKDSFSSFAFVDRGGSHWHQIESPRGAIYRASFPRNKNETVKLKPRDQNELLFV